MCACQLYNKRARAAMFVVCLVDGGGRSAIVYRVFYEQTVTEKVSCECGMRLYKYRRAGVGVRRSCVLCGGKHFFVFLYFTGTREHTMMKYVT